jgi:hypothetical protein
MGTFAETAIIDYHKSCADKGKQTTVFLLRFQQTNRSLPFSLSVCSKQTEGIIFCWFRFLFAGAAKEHS